MIGMLHDVDLSTPPATGDLLVAGADKIWRPGSGAAPIKKHQEYALSGTPATVYTLTYVPTDGSVLLARKLSGTAGGLLLIEDSDYTVDHAIGEVTVSATLASGDTLIARYETLGALSASVYLARDTFNRSDSATTLNPASDTGTWSLNDPQGITPVYGIKSNAAFAVNNVGPGEFPYRDTGQVATDMRLDVAWTSFQRTEFYFAFDPTGGTSYFVNTSAQLLRVSANTPTGWTTGTLLGTFSASVGNGQTTRILYAPATGDIELFVNGVSQGVINDPTPLTGAGNTCVGFGSTQTYYVGGGSSGTVNTGETWDNFKAVTV